MGCAAAATPRCAVRDVHGVEHRAQLVDLVGVLVYVRHEDVLFLSVLWWHRRYPPSRRELCGRVCRARINPERFKPCGKHFVFVTIRGDPAGSVSFGRDARYCGSVKRRAVRVERRPVPRCGTSSLSRSEPGPARATCGCLPLPAHRCLQLAAACRRCSAIVARQYPRTTVPIAASTGPPFPWSQRMPGAVTHTGWAVTRTACA
jgi:hypothetical protein